MNLKSLGAFAFLVVLVALAWLIVAELSGR